MNRSVFARLLLKDLYFSGYMLAGSMLLGLGSLVLLHFNRVTFYVGSVSLVCVLVILNIFVVMQSIITERKEKTQLFVLSLPISTIQYVRQKLLFNVLAFFIPWLLLTLATVAAIGLFALPKGLVPFSVAVLTYLLFYNCVLLAVTLAADSIGWNTAVVIAGNVSINFVITYFFTLSPVRGSIWGPVTVWTPDLLAIIAADLGCGLLALALGYHFASRKRDFT